MAAGAEATLVEVAAMLEVAGARAEAELAAVDFAEARHTAGADIAAVTAGTLVIAGATEAGIAADSEVTTAGRIIMAGCTGVTTIRSGGIPIMSTHITTAILRMITGMSDTPTLLQRRRRP